MFNFSLFLFVKEEDKEKKGEKHVSNCYRDILCYATERLLTEQGLDPVLLGALHVWNTGCSLQHSHLSTVHLGNGDRLWRMLIDAAGRCLLVDIWLEEKLRWRRLVPVYKAVFNRSMRLNGLMNTPLRNCKTLPGAWTTKLKSPASLDSVTSYKLYGLQDMIVSWCCCYLLCTLHLSSTGTGASPCLINNSEIYPGELFF